MRITVVQHFPIKITNLTKVVLNIDTHVFKMVNYQNFVLKFQFAPAL